MTILSAILVLRLFVLTVVEHGKWSEYAEDMTMRAVFETAPRGDITDRNGEIIATSKAVYSVNISRVDLDREEALTSANNVMADLKNYGENIMVTGNEVRELIEDKSYTSYMPILLAEDISSKSATAIKEAQYPGVAISVNYIREYPKGPLASHTIGYLGRISEENRVEYVDEKGYRTDALIGKSGIEEVYEEQLKGTDGITKLQVNSLGNVTELIEKTEVKKGENIKLTLDADLQKTAESALQEAVEKAAAGGTFVGEYGTSQMIYAPKASSGAAVAVDVKSGEVLAIASFPDFDPNDFVKGISTEKWNALQQENPNDPLSPAPLYNVATMSAVQPGSAFKPVTALAALSSGLDENRAIYDGGYKQLGEQKFGCSLWNDTGATHGYMDLKSAIKVSCNYYFFDIASTMEWQDISGFGKRLGLGQKTGIQVGESEGTVPSARVKKLAVKAGLKAYLTSEGEKYFEKSLLKDSKAFAKKLENIVNWAYKDLTLDEIIGKLKQEQGIKEEKIVELAEVCKYSYFDRMEWSLGDTYNISIGQGDNAYTAVQMAGYMATLGNGGVRNDLTLVCERSEGISTETGIDRDHIKLVLDAMTEVTTVEGGSLYGVFDEFSYSVAAKTGTAQRAGKINTQDEKDYLKRHLHLIAPDLSFAQVETEAARLMDEYPDIYITENGALRRAVMNLSKSDVTAEDIDRFKDSYDNFAWTVALAPADNPQIAVAVMLVQGKTSSNAAPVVREIIGKYGEIARWEK